MCIHVYVRETVIERYSREKEKGVPCAAFLTKHEDCKEEVEFG